MDPAAWRYLSDKMAGSVSALSGGGHKIYVGIPAVRSLSDNGDYVALVTRAAHDFKAFSTFKSHRLYRSILEHVTPQQGADYLAILKAESPDLLERIDDFKINDLVGSPLTHNYAEVGTISPTTLRYIKVVSDLRKHFGRDIGDKVVEIGGGYGGQMLVNDLVFRMKEHHIYDLPPVLELTARYLEAHVLNSSYRICTLNQNAGGENYDLVISNYAFSELPTGLQHKYIDKILARSSKGYLTMNSGREGSTRDTNRLSIDELRAKLPPFEVIEERPLTAPQNYIIVWGHRSQ